MTGSTPSVFSPGHRPATLAILASTALVSYNNLSVSAASPEIGADLGSIGLLPWVITAELLATAVAVLAIGPIVDGYGARVVFRSAMLAFIASSLACALATSMPMLIVFRIGQGVGAGGVIGCTLAAVGLGYDAELRPRMYAVISAVWGVMGVGGPAIAALLVSLGGWRTIFTFTIPIGALATALGWQRLPDRHEGNQSAAFDTVGFVVMAALVISLLVAASTDTRWAFAWLAAVVVFGLIYRWRARRITDPVLRLGHLSGRRWRHVHLVTFLAIAGGTGASAYLPLFMRAAKGASAGTAAFSVLFFTFGWTVGAFVASKMQESVEAAVVLRRGARILVISMVGSASVVLLDASVAGLFASTAFAGAGIGVITTSSLSILQSRAGADEMGRVSSAHQFIRSLAWTYGAAIGGLVIFAVVANRVGDVEAVRDLLASEDADIDQDTVEAVRLGYGAAAVTTGAFTAGCLYSARQLVKNMDAFRPATSVAP